MVKWFYAIMKSNHLDIERRLPGGSENFDSMN